MRTLLSIWGALALFCTISFAAPKIKARVDEWAEPPPGTWFDVVVRIDPAGEPLAAKGLTVTVTAKGVETKAALLPPVGATGAYAKPFEVRVPAKAPGLAAAVKLAIKVTGTTAGGAVVNAAGKATVLVAEGRNDAVATAKLKAPAKAGVPNAIVIRVDQIKAGLTLYGEKGEGEKTAGIPTVGRLLPAWGATSEALWTGGAATKAPGKKYSEPFEFEVPFTPAKAGSMSLRVFVAWQACDLSFCYSTEIRYLPLTFDVAKGKKSSRIGPVVEAPVDGGADAAGGQEDLAKKGWIQLLLLAIGGGLFALAMPCTYPLIPITISFFTKQAEAKEGKVLGLALAYGAGIVAVFILVGLVFGEAIVEFATAWQVNAVFALLFLLFGLSLIGLFEIQLPGFMNNVAAKASGTGGYLSVFAMGTTLVITSFTCTAPIVGAVIVFAGKG
ncbi:MAG: hypothetical protein OER88_12640, partial [Planctomycetota bacterium]|nr:hypothetical protein [Planctomycetota bacterium]